MIQFKDLYSKIRVITQTEIQAQELTQVIFELVDSRQERIVTREYLDLKIEHIDLKLELIKEQINEIKLDLKADISTNFLKYSILIISALGLLIKYLH